MGVPLCAENYTKHPAGISSQKAAQEGGKER